MISLAVTLMATSTAISKLKMGAKEKLHLSTDKQCKPHNHCVGMQSILDSICLEPSLENCHIFSHHCKATAITYLQQAKELTKMKYMLEAVTGDTE